MADVTMGQMETESFVAGLAIIGIVIIVSALLSGLVDRSGLPQVAVFILIGAALGPLGFGVFDMQLDSPVLRIVATLSLTLVLFTDAVTLNTKELRRRTALAFRMLGPGTIVCAALTALAAWWLLGIAPASAAILGAALASTDPVLLRSLLRRRDIPLEARHALQLESGLNDVVLLPIVVVAIALTGQHDSATTSFAKMGFGLFILGPGAGIAIGLIAVSALDLIRKRIGIRRDYESLYSIGVAFSAFAAAEAVHGSGFLAAFAAGLTIAALDVELCDCFIEYGGVTAEMLLLFTFVIFGSSLIWTGFTGLDARTVIFAVFTILIRVPVYLLSLIGSTVDRRGRLLIAWYGPRGLSSLLLILLAVFAGVAGSDRLFRVSALIVLISIVVHGASPMLLTRIAPTTGPDEPKEPPPPSPPEPKPEPAKQSRSLPIVEATESVGKQSITLEEFQQLEKSGEKVVLLDVRTERSRDPSEFQAKGSVRLAPESVVAQAREKNLPKEAWLIAYCA
ncbi:MAG TPA: cation:proton antiporter [Pyrinomonadaceae bacterium]|nr:cation:proton antiporter [Pyrinomonadaceae bacterium]